MTAERLEQLRLAIADMHWEFGNNLRDMRGEDRAHVIEVLHGLSLAMHRTIELRDNAREREAVTR
jgi:hypothetical protein